MENEFAKSKPIGDILLEDMLRFPIWTWALDEEDVEGQDETWVKPIISDNVEKIFITVYILLKTEISDSYVLAHLDVKDMTLIKGDIHIWEESQWLNIDDCKNITYPVYFVSIPKIKGDCDVRFFVENKNEYGKSLNSTEKESFWKRLWK